jgi:hypothetical protein
MLTVRKAYHSADEYRKVAGLQDNDTRRGVGVEN